MLTNENFEITIRIENEFDLTLENVMVCLTVPAPFRNKGLSICE